MTGDIYVTLIGSKQDVASYGIIIMASIGLGNYWLPNGTKSLPDPVLT